MVVHRTRLSSSELSGIWQSYHVETMAYILTQYFLHFAEDPDIRALLHQVKDYREAQLNELKNLFNREQIILPTGYTEEDINYSAPRLFYDPFALSFVYMMARIDLINLAFITGNIVRRDILELFKTSLSHAFSTYEKATALMLSKGLYDRPPNLPYPKKNEFVKGLKYLLEGRPINVLELSEVSFNIERNYFSLVLCTALAQTATDKEIKEFLLEGKKISEKQIKFFNEVLTKDELLGSTPIQMDVTAGNLSPFSDRLVMGLFTALNTIDITLIGHGMSLFMRSDLQLNSAKFFTEILQYTVKGFHIMTKRKWLEQPPQDIKRT